MPINNGIGTSDYTPIKQDKLKAFLNMHLRIARGAIKNKKFPNTNESYYFIDMNAGTGSNNGYDGSPKIFMNSVHKLNIKFKAYFIEKRPENHSQLIDNLQCYRNGSTNGEIYPLLGDHKEWLPRIANIINEKTVNFGLIYTDPTGKTPPFEALAEVSSLKHFLKTDILINCPATNLKRLVGKFRKAHLSEYLEPINKKYWLIGEPFGRHCWSLLFGCNWNKYPSLESKGLYHLSSGEGQEIFHRLNYSKKELEC